MSHSIPVLVASALLAGPRCPAPSLGLREGVQPACCSAVVIHYPSSPPSLLLPRFPYHLALSISLARSLSLALALSLSFSLSLNLLLKGPLRHKGLNLFSPLICLYCSFPLRLSLSLSLALPSSPITFSMFPSSSFLFLSPFCLSFKCCAFFHSSCNHTHTNTFALMLFVLVQANGI